MWSPVVHSTKNETGPVPRTRFKHASCVDPQRRVVKTILDKVFSILTNIFYLFTIFYFRSGLFTRGTLFQYPS